MFIRSGYRAHTRSVCPAAASRGPSEIASGIEDHHLATHMVAGGRDGDPGHRLQARGAALPLQGGGAESIEPDLIALDPAPAVPAEDLSASLEHDHLSLLADSRGLATVNGA